MTLQEAKSLKRGQEIWYTDPYSNEVSKYRVNGKVKIWKTRPEEVLVPIKHGLYDYGHVTHFNMGYFSLTNPGVRKDS